MAHTLVREERMMVLFSSSIQDILCTSSGSMYIPAWAYLICVYLKKTACVSLRVIEALEDSGRVGKSISTLPGFERVLMKLLFIYIEGWQPRRSKWS